MQRIGLDIRTLLLNMLKYKIPILKKIKNSIKISLNFLIIY